MAGPLTDLSVAGKLAFRTIARRLRSELEPAPDLAAFTASMQQQLAAIAPGTIRDYTWIALPAQAPPWFRSKIQLNINDEVSYFVEGRVYANRFLDIYVNPALQLWCKVGDPGKIFRGTRNSHSFKAKSEGELQFGNYFPNDWVDLQGRRKQSDDVYKDVTGELKILVIRWAGSAVDGLRALQATTPEADPDGRVQDEILRIERGDTTPAGWQYLWNLGPAEIFQANVDDQNRSSIHCQTHADVGILQKDVDLPLEETTEISWRWCIDQLPSSIREDTLPSHDYLSLAVEFDNGRDITYYWSSSLPVGAGYDCPLPNWKGKEYHVVVRSGLEGLGQWYSERRNLYADYRTYMGEPPARIVRVWLIANSIFQRIGGRCDYSSIALHGEQGDVAVL